MKIVSPARNIQELELLRKAGVSEVLLGFRQLSRLGSLDLDQLHEMALKAKELDLRPVLEWDILMTQDRLLNAIELLKKIDIELFSAIRVQDVGALAYVRNHLESISIQLILENGNHNLVGVKRWAEAAGPRLEKLILSIELTGVALAHYIQNLSVPVEVLGLGPVLLFYTPRHLLSYQKQDLKWISNDEELEKHHLEAVANAEEGFHKGFRLIENQHGTFMFLAKDYCLVDRLDQLVAMNMGAIRVDLRMNENLDALQEVANLVGQAHRGDFKLNDADQFISKYPQKVTRCFYQANATDVIFKKLKNQNIVRSDEGYVGEVVEVAKDEYTLIHVQSKETLFRVGQTYSFSTAEGKVKEVLVTKLTDLDRNEQEVAKPGDFVMIPYQKSMTPKTVIYSLERGQAC